jgi:hypothetical protein
LFVKPRSTPEEKQGPLFFLEAELLCVVAAAVCLALLDRFFGKKNSEKKIFSFFCSKKSDRKLAQNSELVFEGAKKKTSPGILSKVASFHSEEFAFWRMKLKLLFSFV